MAKFVVGIETWYHHRIRTEYTVSAKDEWDAQNKAMRLARQAKIIDSSVQWDSTSVDGVTKVV